MRTRVRQLPYVGANGTMRVLVITLPMVESLLDGVRYFRVEERPAATRFHISKPSRRRLAHVLRRSPHRDAALAQDGGNVPRATVDLATEGGGRPATLAQHPADRNAAGCGQGPGSEAAPLAFLDQR